MKIVFSIKTVAVLVLGWMIAISCNQTHVAKTNSFVIEPDSLAAWLLSERIETFHQKLDGYNQENPTGLTKEDYLKVIEAQVRTMQNYQNEKGGIVDPVRKKEVYYTTPCYAHSVAILASSGFTQDAELIESGMKALDHSCQYLKEQWAPGNHGDFFTWPVMFAYRHLKSFADSSRLNYWTKCIAGIQPEKFYAYYRNYSMNWNLVHASGEFLRYKEGFTDRYYIDTCLQYQKKHISAEGMYNEWGNPTAYDLFARHYLTGMLALGYHGEHFDYYRKNMTKGAWMSLFMQSPTGELPAGYRSTHHIWNEAEQAMLFEIFASQYQQTGQTAWAGAFKRAAMLSLQNIKAWIRPDGTGYVVKNKFPIQAQQGYETYTAHSTYNMLATAMLAQAYEFAADVDETVCPADLGGYVLPVKPFHKVFASLDGTYLEYDTKGDQKYNPTGIIRVHLKGGHPQLGPSDGIASMWNTEGTSIALGIKWQNADGSWTSLAQQKADPAKFLVVEEDQQKVAFKVVYNIDDVTVTETISIQNNNVHVKASLNGYEGAKKLTWPLLVNNGKEQTKVVQDKQSIQLSLEGKGIKLEIEDPKSVTMEVQDKTYNHRNGIAKVAEVSFEGDAIEYVLSVP